MAIGGCGDNPDEKAENTVRAWVKGVDKADPVVCTKLFSRQFIYYSTGKRGRAGLKRCKRALRKGFGSRRGLSVVLRSIKKTTVNDDKATIKALIDTSGQLKQSTFKLSKHGDRWQIDAVS